MTISAPREVLREFVWLCHRRAKSASEVLREFIEEFVDSRFVEIDARDTAPHELKLFPNDAVESNRVLTCGGAAASRLRGGDS